MAEKVCCSGSDIGGNNGNSAAASAKRSASTPKGLRLRRSKECLRDIRVYLTRDAQESINAGGIVHL